MDYDHNVYGLIFSYNYLTTHISGFTFQYYSNIVLLLSLLLFVTTVTILYHIRVVFLLESFTICMYYSVRVLIVHGPVKNTYLIPFKIIIMHYITCFNRSMCPWHKDYIYFKYQIYNMPQFDIYTCIGSLILIHCMLLLNTYHLLNFVDVLFISIRCMFKYTYYTTTLSVEQIVQNEASVYHYIFYLYYYLIYIILYGTTLTIYNNIYFIILDKLSLIIYLNSFVILMNNQNRYLCLLILIFNRSQINDKNNIENKILCQSIRNNVRSNNQYFWCSVLGRIIYKYDLYYLCYYYFITVCMVCIICTCIHILILSKNYALNHDTIINKILLIYIYYYIINTVTNMFNYTSLLPIIIFHVESIFKCGLLLRLITSIMQYNKPVVLCVHRYMYVGTVGFPALLCNSALINMGDFDDVTRVYCSNLVNKSCYNNTLKYHYRYCISYVSMHTYRNCIVLCYICTQSTNSLMCIREKFQGGRLFEKFNLYPP